MRLHRLLSVIIGWHEFRDSLISLAMENKIKEYGRVGVLMGGLSSERDISLKSGEAVYNALINAGVDAVIIDIVSEDPEKIAETLHINNIDMCFIAMHGKFGEDGTLQEILEGFNIAYTCSGGEASRLCMNKAASKRIFMKNGLYTPNFVICDKDDEGMVVKILEILDFPIVIKPVSAGSSVGLSIVDNYNELNSALEKAFLYDAKIITEEYIAGRELTVGILNGEALPIIEIVPKHRFFDYEAKYTFGLTDYIIPAQLDNQIMVKINNAACLAYQGLGCFGCARIDIILNKNGANPYILEINSIPGFTLTSLLPKAAKAKGIEFSQLCLILLDLAQQRHKDKITLNHIYEEKKY